MKEITPKTKISDVLGNPGAAEILLESGIACIGCPMTMYETIEQGFKVHGMSEKEIDKVVEKLNKKVNKK